MREILFRGKHIAKEDAPVLWKALKIAQSVLNTFFDVEGER